MQDSKLSEVLAALDPASHRYATDAVDRILNESRRVGASDIHLQPAADGLEMRWRLDGVLSAVAKLPPKVTPNVIARLKVLADLLTYRTDVPQEGRIRLPGEPVEMRLCTFPTLHGEKAVIRVFGGTTRFSKLRDIGWPPEIESTLSTLLDSTSGAMIFSGPAGSGKTTSIYAALRELGSRSGGARGIATLEDPIEAAIEGVAQTQVNPAVGLTLESGLRSMLRQDPEVIGRLSDMEIEPYMIRSGLIAVVAQRLVRRLCECAVISDRPEDRLGLSEGTVRLPRGCPACRGTGYLGRAVLCEMLLPDNEALGRGILERLDVRRLESLAVEAGMVTRWERAGQLVSEGVTAPAEIVRVLGANPESRKNSRA